MYISVAATGCVFILCCFLSAEAECKREDFSGRKYLDVSQILTTASDVLMDDEDFIFASSDREIPSKRSKRSSRRKDRDGDIAHILSYLTNKTNYERRIRPNYRGKPVVVNLTMFIKDISTIRESSMDLTVDFYFGQQWHDHRLEFTKLGRDEITVLGENSFSQIWRPDTFFANAKVASFHETTTLNTFLRFYPNGTIDYSLRLTVIVSCPMNFEYFPMDSQRCPIEIESYGYTTRDIVYQWAYPDHKSVEFAHPLASLTQYEMRGHRETQRVQRLSTGNYTRMAVLFYFKREIGYYVIQIYLPSAMIVTLSIISFWINRDQPPARVALGITTVLTMTTLISSANAALPKISYLKAVDIYLFACFLMVFAALIEYAAVTYTAKHCELRETASDGDIENELEPESGENRPVCLCCQRRVLKAALIEQCARVLFPTVFICFNIYYWIVYTNSDSDQPSVEERFIPTDHSHETNRTYI